MKSYENIFRSRYNAARVAPAMQLGVTDRIWSISELVQVALNGVVTNYPIGRKVGWFTVIEGGR